MLFVFDAEEFVEGFEFPYPKPAYNNDGNDQKFYEELEGSVTMKRRINITEDGHA